MNRQELINVIDIPSVMMEHKAQKFQDFIDGKIDVKIRELNIDSLVVMEICISLEENFGVSITTQDFDKSKSLIKLLEFINR